MNVAPDESDTLVDDMNRVAELGHEKRVALLAELVSFKFSMADITPDEAQEVASRVGVTGEDVLAMFRCAYGFEKYEAAHEVVSDAVRASIVDLRSVAQAIRDQFDQLRILEFIMPSYRGMAVSLNLRATPNGDKFDLRPVATVRIHLDEGEPVTFQCVPQGLLAMSRYLKQAADSMARLEAHVSPPDPAK